MSDSYALKLIFRFAELFSLSLLNLFIKIRDVCLPAYASCTLSTGMSIPETEIRSFCKILPGNRDCGDWKSFDNSYGKRKGKIEEVERLGSSVRLRRDRNTEADEHPRAENIEGDWQQSDPVPCRVEERCRENRRGRYQASSHFLRGTKVT